MNEQWDEWLLLSQALFFDLIPANTKAEIGGAGRTRAEYAFLIHRETQRVDRALIDMARAAGEKEVRAVAATLSRETVIALASRWVYYTKQWRNKATAGEQSQWIPPGGLDIWRAIFLSMTTDLAAAEAAARSLWGAAFSDIQSQG